MLAIRPKTGEIVWHYQFTPNDAYDYDAVWELILAELPVDGVKRKVVMQLNRNGFLYVLDRANGSIIAANPYEKVNWASHVDKETGRPVETEVAKTLRSGGQIEMWPSTRGGKNWPHAAFNPETGLLYANTIHEGRLYKHLTIEEFKAGQRYMFVENLNMPPTGEPIGHVDAIDPLTGKQKWRVPLTDHQYWSAMLATGGGLLFTGKETGEFIALDADNGKELWHFQTGSGINAHAGHLHPQRPAVRHGALRHRRALLEPRARAAQERAAGRLGVDLRADAELSRSDRCVIGPAATPARSVPHLRRVPFADASHEIETVTPPQVSSPTRSSFCVPVTVAGAAQEPTFPPEADRQGRIDLLAQLLALPRHPHAGPGKRLRPAQVPARPARALRQLGDARQEHDAAVGRSPRSSRHRGAVVLCGGGRKELAL